MVLTESQGWVHTDLVQVLLFQGCSKLQVALVILRWMLSTVPP